HSNALSARSRCRHRSEHAKHHDDVSRHNDEENRNGLEQSCDHSLTEEIEAFEQALKLDRLATHVLKEAKINAAHHRAHQHDREGTADQHAHQADAEKEPVLTFDELPGFLETFDGPDDAPVEVKNSLA